MDAGLPDSDSIIAVAAVIYPTREQLLLPSQGRRTPADRLQRRYRTMPDGCWCWLGSVTTNGYGHFSIKSVYYQAHRLVYILHGGTIPEGMTLDHLCRNPGCVNPSHLEPVTFVENVRRGRAAKLTSDEVERIRRMRARGFTTRGIGRVFGVSHSNISRIARGHAWRPAADPADAVRVA